MPQVGAETEGPQGVMPSRSAAVRRSAKGADLWAPGVARRHRRRFAVSFGAFANRDRDMKATVANLVTPHLLSVVDLAKQAEIGGNIEWHLRETVSRTIEALGHQYNARDLLATYIEGLEAAARAKGRIYSAYARALQAAAAQAAQHLEKV